MDAQSTSELLSNGLFVLCCIMYYFDVTNYET